MQKGSAHIFALVGVLIVAAVLSGVYFFSKEKPVNFPKITVNSLVSKITPVQQLVFNEYSNNDFGISFKFSKELTVKTDSEEELNKRGNGNFRKNFKGYVGYDPGQVLGAVAVLGKDGNYDTNPFSIWIFNNDNNLGVEQWFQNYWYYPFIWGVFDYTSKGHIALDTEATISGQPARYKIVTYQPGKPKFVYIAKDQKMYLFRIIGEAGDQILSTFKFTN